MNPSDLLKGIHICTDHDKDEITEAMFWLVGNSVKRVHYGLRIQSFYLVHL